MDHIRNDLRYAVRQLRRNQGVSLIAVVALALGIGITTTVFSFVYGILLRGMPFDEPQEIVHIERTHVARNVDQMPANIHDFTDWRAQQSTLSDIGAFYYGTINLSGEDGAERYSGAFITANTFDLLRAKPMLGRTFRAGEDRPGAAPVIILGYDVWRDRFGSDAEIVGKTLRANGEAVTVVGVMPQRFEFPYVQQMWVPLRLDPVALPRGAGPELEVFGRLKPGLSIDRANEDLGAIARRLEAENPTTNDGVGVIVQTFISSVAGEGMIMLYTMLGAVFLVLLVACANVANLLLVRAAGRSREIGIRTALGASRRRVVAQFLSESLVLAVIGGAFGIAIAFAGVAMFNKALSGFDDLPFFISIKVDGNSLLFVLAMTILATIAAGMLPALQAARADAGEVLKDESRGTSSFRIGRTSRAVVITEIAFSCTLLVASGLMIRSIINLRTADYGFATADVFTARVGLPDAKYPDAGSLQRFYEELHRRLARIPGVQAVSLGSGIPVAVAITPLEREPVALEGRVYNRDSDLPLTGSLVVAPGYFDALDVAPRAGRDFSAADRTDSRPVALVNESFARRYFPGADPVGRRIRMGGIESTESWRTIVGVVPDLGLSGPKDPDPDGIYIPMAQSPQRFVSIVARSSSDPLALTSTVRDIVADMDSDIPIYHVHSLAGAIHDETWFYRIFGGVFTILGVVALMLASVGLYGVMAFSVKRRTREVGIRIALGARVGDVLRLILGHGFGQIAIGLTIGLSLAAAVSRLLSVSLYDVDAHDPMVFGGVVVILTLSGLAACLVPAVRASRVDPMTAIRSD